MKYLYHKLLSIILLLLFFGISVEAQGSPEPMSVLVLDDLGTVSIWREAFSSSLTESLRNDPGFFWNISYEYLGLERVPEGENPEEVINYLRYKYPDGSLDLVIAVLPTANRFLMAYGEDLFPGAYQIHFLPGPNDIPGILETQQSAIVESASNTAIQNTLADIPQLLPHTEHIYVVSGSGEGDRVYLQQIENISETLNLPEIEIHYLVDIPVDEIVDTTRNLPQNSAILFSTFMIDVEENTHSILDVISLISETANAPIFGYIDTLVGNGVVGGNFASARSYGETTADVAHQMVSGTFASDNIRVIGNTSYAYDWRQLQQWHIPENRLPVDSEVRFKSLSFWEAYRNTIIITFLVIIIQAIFIIALIAALRQWRLAARDARKRETEFRAIFENSRDAISVSSNGIIVMVNKAFLKMFGYTDAAEMIGKPVGNSIVSEDQARIQNYSLRRDLSDDIPRMYEARAITTSGEVFDLETRVASYKLNDVIFNVAILRNISERKRMETLTREAEVLQTELDKEKKLLELREHFISFLSHEFRQPLAIMQTSLDLLVHYHDRLSQERRAGSHEKISTQIIRLNEMIDNTLNLLRSQSENMSFSPVATDLVRLCEDIVEQVKLTDKKAHQFNFSSTLTEQALMIDVAILKHILINLLGNAVKYSPDESPIYLDLSQSNDTIHISVRDEGIGIPPDDQEKLFETFHRASNVGKRDGTGLGLSIVQQYVTLHGGIIEFESELDKGSTFTVILPLVSASEPSKAAV